MTREPAISEETSLADTTLIGGGEMGDLMRSIDWSKTPVGPVASWPRSLKTTVNMLLNSSFGMFLWWGPELVQFYNDSYRPSFGNFGEKHPKAMGQKGKECWVEIWPLIQPEIEKVMTKGIVTWNENQLVPIYRNGILEEVYWTYSYSPVFGDSGEVAGILVVESETSKQVIGTRRTKLLRELTETLFNTTEDEIIFQHLATTLEKYPEDIPFFSLYMLNPDTNEAILKTMVGLNGSASLKPATISANDEDTWHIWNALRSGSSHEIQWEKGNMEWPGRPWPEKATKAFVSPVYNDNNKTPIGVFIVGISPRQVFNEEYQNLVLSLNRQISAALTNSKAHRKEQLRQQELEKTRYEAEAAHKKLYDLFMNAPAVIAVFSGQDLKFEIANPLYRQLVGVKRELDGIPLFEAIPEIEPSLKEIINNVVRKGERFVANELPVTIDWDMNGNYYKKYLKLLYEPIFKDGHPDGMMVFAYDVTDHVLARERVEEQNNVLKMLSEGTSLNETLEFLVESIEKQSPSEIKCSILLLDEDGVHLRHGAAPNLPDEYNKAIDGLAIGPSVGSCGTAAFTQAPVFVENISTDPLWKDHKDLAEKYHLRACWSTPIFSSSKKVLGTFAIYYDKPQLPTDEDRQIIDFATSTASLLIERKYAEQALIKSTADLQQQKRMYDSITGSTPDLVYVINTDYKFTYVNKALLNMWGKTLEESIGKGFRSLGYELWHAEMHEREIDEVISKKIPIRGEVSFPHATLGERIYDYIFAPIFNENNEVIAIAGTTRDISELKKLEKQKDQFIAIASHELKTPLTSLKAYTQLLQSRFEKNADLVSSDLMKKMDLQINKLTNLINDLLDITRMQGGKLMYNLKPFELNGLVSEITEEIQRTTTSHSLNLYLSEDATIYGDRDRIGQVLTNYLTNAIKYSPKSDVVNIRTSITGNEVTVSVEDFGFGIPADKHEKVFEQFYRVDGIMRETFAGLGIGLFICKEIILRHQGQLWVESEPDKGSVFYFKLPLYKNEIR